MSVTPAVPSRRQFSNVLLAHLKEALSDPKVVVGDTLAPPDGGWGGQQPGSGSYSPYVVYKPGNASPGQARETVGLDYGSWNVGFTLVHNGGSRDQTEWVGDQVRAALTIWRPRLQLADVTWVLQQVVFTQLGGATPDNQTSPSYWEAADTAIAMLSR